MKRFGVVLSLLLSLFWVSSAGLRAEVLQAEAGADLVGSIDGGSIQGSTGVIEGYVTDARTGFPIFGAVVRVTADGYAFTTQSNWTGYFELSVPAGRGYVMTVTKTNYQDFTALTRTIGVGARIRIDAALVPVAQAGAISGCVFDDSTNAPLPGARVLISGAQTLTDGSGCYSLEVAEGRSHTLLVQMPGYKGYYESSIEVRGEVGVSINVYLASVMGGAAPVPPGFTGRGPRSGPPGWWWMVLAAAGFMVMAFTLRRKFGGLAPVMAGTGAIILILSAALLPSCENPSIGSAEPIFDEYRLGFVGNGTDRIQIYQQPAHYFGQAIDYTSFDNTTVFLTRLSDSEPVGGTAGAFDVVDCLLGKASCALGGVFMPGGPDPCDLDGDTVYALAFDGLRTKDGDTLPAQTFIFRTAPVPPGYTPHLCSDFIVLWWTIRGVDETQGLQSPFSGNATIILTGIKDHDPWAGIEAVDSPYYVFAALNQPGGWTNYYRSNLLIDPPYIPLLKIYNNSESSLDLGTVEAAVTITDDQGQALAVTIPADVIPPWETLALYVGKHGETYYAFDKGGVHLMDLAANPACRSADPGCEILAPPDAFAQPPAARW